MAELSRIVVVRNYDNSLLFKLISVNRIRFNCVIVVVVGFVHIFIIGL